jgi:AcrR family transcriptional regulator
MPINAPRRRKAEAKAADEAARSTPRNRAALAAPAVKKTAMADRRARILQVAAKRFAEFGFAATTVRQIADDVNILSGSLFHHFTTKEEMLHEILRDPISQMRDNIDRIARAPVDAEHRLIALILLDLGELTRNQEVHAILYNERKIFRHRDEFAYVLEAKKKAYFAWKSALEEGMKAHLFRSNIDVYLTISTILRMLNVSSDWYKNEDQVIIDSYSMDQVLNFHLDFILSAVRTPARMSEPVPRKACEELAKFQN